MTQGKWPLEEISMARTSGKVAPQSHSYLDFESEIATSGGRDYPVAAINSPAGEVRDYTYWSRLSCEWMHSQ
jgi:hypothetical protein